MCYPAPIVSSRISQRCVNILVSCLSRIRPKSSASSTSPSSSDILLQHYGSSSSSLISFIPNHHGTASNRALHDCPLSQFFILHTFSQHSDQLETSGFQGLVGFRPRIDGFEVIFQNSNFAHAQIAIPFSKNPHRNNMGKTYMSYISELQAPRNVILVSYCAESDRLVE